MTKLAVGNYATMGVSQNTANRTEPITDFTRPASFFGGNDRILADAALPSQSYINKQRLVGKLPQYEAEQGKVTRTVPNSSMKRGPFQYGDTTYAGGIKGSEIDGKLVIGDDAILEAAAKPSAAYQRSMQPGTQSRTVIDKIRADYGENPTIPKATPVAEPAAAPAVDPALVARLFQKTTGTAYNEKSKKDIAKMQEIQDRLKGMGGNLGGMSDTQFALKTYGRK